MEQNLGALRHGEVSGLAWMLSTSAFAHIGARVEEEFNKEIKEEKEKEIKRKQKYEETIGMQRRIWKAFLCL